MPRSHFSRFRHRVRCYLIDRHNWPAAKASRFVSDESSYLRTMYENSCTAHIVAENIIEMERIVEDTAAKNTNASQ